MRTYVGTWSELVMAHDFCFRAHGLTDRDRERFDRDTHRLGAPGATNLSQPYSRARPAMDQVTRDLPVVSTSHAAAIDQRHDDRRMSVIHVLLRRGGLSRTRRTRTRSLRPRAAPGRARPGRWMESREPPQGALDWEVGESPSLCTRPPSLPATLSEPARDGRREHWQPVAGPPCYAHGVTGGCVGVTWWSRAKGRLGPGRSSVAAPASAPLSAGGEQ